MIHSSPENIIVKLEKTHVDEIVRLAEVCNLAVWSKNDYLEEIERADSIGYVAASLINKEKINGFLVARLIKFQNTDSKNYSFVETGEGNIDSEFECEILNIAVNPSARKQGIGQTLLKKFFQRCISENVTAIWLEVRFNNENAVNFYQRNDFEVIYRRKNYYVDPPDDALVMKKDLK